MRMIPASWRTLFAGTALALALTPALAPAAPAAPEKETTGVNPIEKLRKDLDKPLTLKVEKQPLSTAIEMLREKTKINFVVDTLTIQQQLGFTLDQPPSPVEVDVKDVKTRSVLRMILSPYGLSFAPISDMVVITTEEAAMYRQMRQRINLDMEKVEFAAALKQIGRETAVNLLLDSRVEKEAAARVSLQMEDVPLETAVRLLAEMAGLKPIRVGNVLFVTSKANANEMRNDPDLAQPNVNLRAQQELMIQQQFQLQGGFNVPGGIALPGGGIGVPPGIAPVVPPLALPTEPAKDKTIEDPKPKDDTAPPAGDKKEQKDAPPIEVKPLTK